ncbi:hypothetical protein [Paraburkholderia elongata]|uniref:Uncharacterized protein n=1 Tax=Paraburkholderia elongata TaxID=2675747 RepID=A0A972SNG2_9BURK|nr:hypothetical protein [Paraburkholderia elongata]NPT61274.1 hypothetical protein [Paraburkholderia elongata]
MLSPHEIATLMLVKDAPGRIDPGRAELHALLDLELVTVERPAAGFPLPNVTPLGDAILRSIARLF